VGNCVTLLFQYSYNKTQQELFHIRNCVNENVKSMFIDKNKLLFSFLKFFMLCFIKEEKTITEYVTPVYYFFPRTGI
jgi:hypothetical protein